MKSKLIILIFLVVLALIYISATRGEWTTKIEQEYSNPNTKNNLIINDFLSIESEHFISEDQNTIGSHTILISKKCFKIDSLSFSISEIENGNEIVLTKFKSRIADINKLEFDSQGNIKEESLFQNWKIEVCPINRIEISNWFETKNSEINEFIINYFIKTTENELIKGKTNLHKKTDFEIQGRHHFDFIILLYPFLWGILLILLIFGIIKSLRKKTNAQHRL